MQSSIYTVDGVGACAWWLRSSGYDSGYAALVLRNGCIDYIGLGVYTGTLKYRQPLRFYAQGCRLCLEFGVCKSAFCQYGQLLSARETEYQPPWGLRQRPGRPVVRAQKLLPVAP